MKLPVAIDSLDNVDDVVGGDVDRVEGFDQCLELGRFRLLRIERDETSRGRRRAGLHHDVLVRDHHGPDLHVAADHDAPRTLVDHHFGARLLIHQRRGQDLRDEQHGIVTVLRGNRHFDVDLIDGPGQGDPVDLDAQLAVDPLGHVGGDLEVGVVLVQHQRDLSVLDEGVEEVLLQPASRVNPSGGGRVGIFQGDRPFGEGVHPGLLGVLGSYQRRQEQPPALEALGRPDRADHAVDPVALAASGGGHRGGDGHQGHVLGVLQLAGRAHRFAHQLQGDRQAPDGRQEFPPVAGSLQSDDYSHAVQRVFFLALDAADTPKRRPPLGRDSRQPGQEHEQHRDQQRASLRPHRKESFSSSGVRLLPPGNERAEFVLRQPVRTAGTGRATPAASRGGNRRGRGRIPVCGSAFRRRSRFVRCCWAGRPWAG